MTRIFSRWSSPARALIVAAVVALAVAGCGSSSNGAKTTAYGGAKPASTASGSAASVALASSKLGNILVDKSGRTLYLFEADKGKTSACNGACASAWPPVTTGARPMAGHGIAAAKLGTTKRADGTTEVTYNGHPLYTYAGDAKAGQTTGQGMDQFGAEWYVLSAAGQKIEH
jgi:predicted lipoprotein with Yx(FWY)xxD motif